MDIAKKEREIIAGNLPGDNLMFKSIPGVNKEFSPGFGVIFSFSDKHKLEDPWIIGYRRPNPEANQAQQVCIATGGAVGLEDDLVEKINSNLRFKLNLEELGELEVSAEQLMGVPASVYNHDGDGWNMSYVYAHVGVDMGLEELRKIVAQINENIDAKENPKLGHFGIYRAADIVDIVKTNSKLEEDEKKPKEVTNYATNEKEEVIVFDDYGTQPLLASFAVKSQVECKSIDLLNGTKEVLGVTDGAGVLYGVMHKNELHFVLRERVRAGKSKFQVGVGGKFTQGEDQSLFHRAQTEAGEEFYLRLKLNQGMLVRHADRKGHLVHFMGKVGKYGYAAGLAINAECNNPAVKVGVINYYNGLLWPFGDFFINNMQFNPNYTLEKAQADVKKLIAIYAGEDENLSFCVPKKIMAVLKAIDEMKDLESLDDLKKRVIDQFTLEGAKPFLALADEVDQSMLKPKALSDYTEAKSSGLMKAEDLFALLKGETDAADIVYFDEETGEEKETRSITAGDVFNRQASESLLHCLFSPEYEKELTLATTKPSQRINLQFSPKAARVGDDAKKVLDEELEDRIEFGVVK